jgi:hypothetical protein
MDTNWCLTCERHTVRYTTPPLSFHPSQSHFSHTKDIAEENNGYCSSYCRGLEAARAGHAAAYPSPPQTDDLDLDGFEADMIVGPCHQPAFQGKHPDGIRAWARAIPSAVPRPHPASSLPGLTSTSSSSTSLSLSVPSMRSHSHRLGLPRSANATPSSSSPLPQLMMSSRRPLTPTLGMSTPQPSRPRPSLPKMTSKQSIASVKSRDLLAQPHHGTPASSTGVQPPSSYVSRSHAVIPEVCVTPSARSTRSVVGALAHQLRSWTTGSVPPSELAHLRHRPPTLRVQTQPLTAHEIDVSLWGMDGETSEDEFLSACKEEALVDMDPRSGALYPKHLALPVTPSSSIWNDRGRKTARVTF